jgi:Golgi nucleoside diphosphatase
MIDAGSQGTRLHVYEFEARILEHRHEFENAIAGRKLSFPTTDTRWTNRLQPGLDSFAYMEQYDQMMREIEKYLQPLWDFAKLVLEPKHKQWSTYPIFLKVRLTWS